MTGPNAEPGAETLSPQEKLKWCLENLGQRITTVGLGISDASRVRGWLVTPESIPDGEVAPLDLLYGAAKRVADVYDAQTARAFLRSSNPYANDRSLLEFTAWAGTEEEAQQTTNGAIAYQVVNGAVDAFLS